MTLSDPGPAGKGPGVPFPGSADSLGVPVPGSSASRYTIDRQTPRSARAKNREVRRVRTQGEQDLGSESDGLSTDGDRERPGAAPRQPRRKDDLPGGRTVRRFGDSARADAELV